jgi:hypothetical protein
MAPRLPEFDEKAQRIKRHAIREQRASEPAISGINGAKLAAIWAFFGCLIRDKRLYMPEAELGWLGLPRRQLHPVKLKPAAGPVRLG